MAVQSLKKTVAGTVRMALAAAALAGGLTAPALAQDKVLNAVPYADLRNLDPVWTTAIITRHHAYMIYDTLFAMNSKLEPKPQMVGDYSISDDGMSYSFTLRDGLTFHNGDPVTTADVVASIKRWEARDNAGGALANATESLTAIDDKTFELKLASPFGLVLDTLAGLSGPFIMPEAVAQTDPFEQVKDYTGSGPFVFNEAEWVPGNKVVYDKFEGYVPRDEPADGAAGGKVVKVDRVVWSYLPDPATALAALQTGEIDFWEAPPADLLPVVEANPDTEAGVLDPFGLIVILRPNHLYPPFDKKEARQAMMYAVKQSDYMTAMVGNPDYWQECPSLMMCNTPMETSAGGGEIMLESDMDKAKELMSSVYNGETVVVMHPTDHPSGPTALLTADLLRQMGVKVELQAMDWATLTSRRSSKNAPEDGGWSIFHTRTGVGSASPISHSGVAAGETAWFGWPQNEEVEALRAKWAAEPDQAKRFAIMEELETLMMDTAPFVMLGQITSPSAWRSNVSGMLSSPVLGFWNIEVE
ncbi:ABC transporter substrate-binding protein [Pseudooceanicola nanhaiensis]|uniref:ABC transporter substrate-binding protein n=1 Tax=Pseudooceanicola nanhaiensis TaxID=375761 RepID=UPI001CD7C0DB|nr:ABC transporter substrate-binding protein [Pseudooceanicola nanhaiensis]MCA0922157.1 ABC transporter substrate-binding protein [Pseudooceanicola nanhaiensis]